MSNFLSFFGSQISNCETGCLTNLPKIKASSANLQTILQIIFGIIAAATVIYIIVATLRYQVSLGNPDATAKLRNSIIYAAVGLVIALSAEVIVTFVLGRV